MLNVSYKGMDKGFQYRVADINFSDDEMHKVERIAFLMGITGWLIDIVSDGYAQCEVDNRECYEDFMKDWKACKRTITNCMKYGF